MRGIDGARALPRALQSVRPSSTGVLVVLAALAGAADICSLWGSTWRFFAACVQKISVQRLQRGKHLHRYPPLVSTTASIGPVSTRATGMRSLTRRESSEPGIHCANNRERSGI